MRPVWRRSDWQQQLPQLLLVTMVSYSFQVIACKIFTKHESFSVSKGLITVWRIGSYLRFKATLTSNLFESVFNKSSLFVSLNIMTLRKLWTTSFVFWVKEIYLVLVQLLGKLRLNYSLCYGLIFFKFQFICRIHFILNLILLN